MKSKRLNLLLLFVLLIVFSTNGIDVSAMHTGFSTEEMSEEEKNRLVSVYSISLLTEEPEKSEIRCFDVNEQGMIAVGRQDIHEKEIVCVYTSQGEFLYGYKFDTYGSFYVEWDDKCINLINVRSDIIMSLDSKGNLMDAKKILNSFDNTEYMNSLDSTSTRTVGSTTYLVRNKMGILNWICPNYSQIVTIDAEGKESIIYDVNAIYLAKMILILSMILALFSTAVIVLTRQHIKWRQENHEK